MSYQQDTKFVDDSVTANLASEFANFDWDVLILHYLGLDHVGHSAGPNSLLMPPKQREMDAIIKYILEQLIDKDKAGSLPTLFVVCSDHGMSEVGNHGGSSALETATITVMMSSVWMNSSHNLNQTAWDSDVEILRGNRFSKAGALFSLRIFADIE